MTERERREANAEQATGPERDENGDWKTTVRPLTPVYHKPQKPVMFITFGEWTSKHPDDAGDCTIAQARQGVRADDGRYYFVPPDTLEAIPMVNPFTVKPVKCEDSDAELRGVYSGPSWSTLWTSQARAETEAEILWLFP